jgi:hypothetical protein
MHVARIEETVIVNNVSESELRKSPTRCASE